MFKFEHEGKRSVYLQRLLDTCTTTSGYKVDDIMAGKYGPPGRRAAELPDLPAHSVLRAGPRQRAVPHRHRAGCTPTPTSPRRSSTARTSSSTARGPRRRRTCRTSSSAPNPLVRPEDYGISRAAEHWDDRTIRNVKMPWVAGEGRRRTSSGRRASSSTA